MPAISALPESAVSMIRWPPFASTIPVAGQEKVVLRFLQRFDLVPDLEQLGMAADSIAKYQRSLKRPGSFCVIAGPTGSGKSTTSLLKKIAAL